MSREMDRTKRDWIRQWTHERLGDAIPRENEPLDWNLQMLDALDAKDERIAELEAENERLKAAHDESIELLRRAGEKEL